MSELRLLPNQLTALRVALVPLLWIAALLGHPVVVGAGLALCFVTDWGDGYAARRLGIQSSWGSRFDSIADAMIGPSVLAWLALLEPSVLTGHWLLLACWLGATYGSLVLGMLKFRRVANLHLRSSRIACVFQYAFVVDAFVAPPVFSPLLYAAFALGMVSSLETLVLQLVRSRVHEHHVSLLRWRTS